MATKGSKKERSSQEYEVAYLAKKLGVSSQAIGGAKHATGSSKRKTLRNILKIKTRDNISASLA